MPVDHATKKPLVRMLPRDDADKPTWHPFTECLADEETARRWFSAGCEAYAVVCGAVSGGLVVIDCDEPEFYERWRTAASDLADGLPVQRTGRGGYHVLLRCPDPGSNQKLAWAVDAAEPAGRHIAVETRGERGYAIMAPSRHPSGGRYELLAGDLGSVPRVSQAKADALIATARKLDEAPQTRQELAVAATAKASHGNLIAPNRSVIQAFNAKHSIREVLLSHGYRESGVPNRLVRPNGESPSVLLRDDGRSYHFSSSDRLCDRKAHDAFDAFCVLSHGGDVAAAVRQLRAATSPPPVVPQVGDEPSQPVEAGTDTDNTHAGESGTGVLSVSVVAGSQRTALKPFRPFPIECLPQPFMRFVTQGAAALGVDAAYLALPVLVCAGAAIGNSRRILLKHGWEECPVLWACTVGDSGSLKSPSLDTAMRFTRRRQDRFFAEYKKEVARYQEEHRAWKAQPKSDRGAEPERPKPCERVWCSDTTVEAIADRLLDSPRGLLLGVDELPGWLSSFNLYKGRDSGPDVAHWLSMHRAASLMVDRKTGQRPVIHVPNAAVSVIGGIQPGALRRALTSEFYDNGLAARLLLTYPPRLPKRWTEDEIDPLVESLVEKAFDQLFSLNPEPGVNSQCEPVRVPLTDGAKELWIAFVNQTGREQVARYDERVIAAWSKLEGYAARLALIVQMVRAVSDKSVSPWWIDETSIEAGIELTRWFGYETERVYAILDESEAQRHVRRLIERIRSLGGSVTPRGLMRAGPCYANAEKARAALNLLVDLRYGRWDHPRPGRAGGAPTEVFVLVNDAGESG